VRAEERGEALAERAEARPRPPRRAGERVGAERNLTEADDALSVLAERALRRHRHAGGIGGHEHGRDAPPVAGGDQERVRGHALDDEALLAVDAEPAP